MGQRQELWTKLWPFFQRYEQGPRGRSALPALNPLWHLPVIDEHYSWIYELYAHESDGEQSRERSWGGIWRRETDAYEERTYVAGLWSRRKYREEGADGARDVAPVRPPALAHALGLHEPAAPGLPRAGLAGRALQRAARLSPAGRRRPGHAPSRSPG